MFYCLFVIFQLQHSLMNVSREALSYEDLHKLLDEGTWSQLQIISRK